MLRLSLSAAAALLLAGTASAQQMPAVDARLAQGISDAVSLSGIRRSSSMQISRQTLSTINARVGRVSEDDRGDVYVAAFLNDTGAASTFDDLDFGPNEDALLSSLKAATGVSSDEASRVRSDLYQVLIGADYQLDELSLGGLVSYARFDVESTPGSLLSRLGAVPGELEGNGWLGAAYANYLFTPSLYSTVIAIYGRADSENSGSSSRYSGLEGSLNATASSGRFIFQGRAALRHLNIEFNNPALTRAREQYPQFERVFEREVSSDTAILGGEVSWLLSPRVLPFVRASYEIALAGPEDEGLYGESGVAINLTETTAMSLSVQWSSFNERVSNSGVAFGLRTAF